MSNVERLYTAEQVEKALRSHLEHRPRVMAIADLMSEPEGHQARFLRYQKKQLARELGKAGNRIYDLRCQLAEARACNQIDPTAYRGLVAQLRDAQRKVSELEEELKEMSNEEAPQD